MCAKNVCLLEILVWLFTLLVYWSVYGYVPNLKIWNGTYILDPRTDPHPMFPVNLFYLNTRPFNNALPLTGAFYVSLNSSVYQGCGSVSGSGLDPDSIGSVDPDPDSESESDPIRSGSLFFNFWSLKPLIRIGSGSVFSLKCWIRIRMKWMRIRNPASVYRSCWDWWSPWLRTRTATPITWPSSCSSSSLMTSLRAAETRSCSSLGSRMLFQVDR